MLDFQLHRSPEGEDVLRTSLHGIALLETPLLNKGTAFEETERHRFGLDGLLPAFVTDIQTQLHRIYGEFSFKSTEMEKHIYLRGLQDRNEVLFYRLLLDHVEEMMPLIYTPTVGAACRHFSNIYRRPRGLFLTYPQRDEMVRLLDNRPVKDVDVIVVTDGERILGLGDQGAGGMGIPIGKLSLYTLCGGIHPARTLPIFLDVGTDNESRLADPHYLGWRNPRVRGDAYLAFIDQFVEAVKQVFPNVLLQWEDFARDNASFLLEKYRDDLCTFNDDIQGTAAVTVAALLSAMQRAGTALRDQRVVLLGAGSASIGIANQLADAMIEEGLTESEAVGRFWVLNSRGLMHEEMGGVQPFQRRFLRPKSNLAAFEGLDPEHIPLYEVVKHAHPTVLVGVSGKPAMFTEAIVREMARHAETPIIFPLSNPTSQTEAQPKDLIAWTEGRAVVATGSPFDPVEHEGRTHPVAQCNNSYVFPGVGLGVVASKARRVTAGMFMAASRELARVAASFPGAPILPPLTSIRDVSRAIARQVALAAIAEGVAAPLAETELDRALDTHMWVPRYPRLG
ncbi:MAG: NAD-dependent malic enzyme [Fimbriimonadaceae bacterium]|nr:NAD-dependent malic enzyme [Chthonomonadaceae bacterium]MCO5296390.1 NAD-dependent malic enzyme [Fimbriimonadaceae bacterium]